MTSDSRLTVPVLDAMSNLNLTPDLLISVSVYDHLYAYVELGTKNQLRTSDNFLLFRLYYLT